MLIRLPLLSLCDRSYIVDATNKNAIEGYLLSTESVQLCDSLCRRFLSRPYLADMIDDWMIALRGLLQRGVFAQCSEKNTLVMFNLN